MIPPVGSLLVFCSSDSRTNALAGGDRADNKKPDPVLHDNKEPLLSSPYSAGGDKIEPVSITVCESEDSSERKRMESHLQRQVALYAFSSE